MILALALVIPAYLIGTIPFSVLIARAAGYDLYTQGSRNPGASNVARIAGWKWGAVAMVLDIFKGFAPTILTLIVLDHFLNAEQTRLVAYLVASAAILGHVAPIARKGGKGIATGGGAALALLPIPGICVIAIWIVTMKISKLPVVSSLIAAATLVVITGFMHHFLWEFFVVLALFLVVSLRHISNIRRLINRSESGVGLSDRVQYQDETNIRRQVK